MDVGEVKELPVVIKGDVQGSIETLKETLSGMGGEKIQIQVVTASVGGITENDVNLASASKAVIIGFNVRPEPRAQTLADDLGVDIRIYNIIYELIEEVEKALLGMLDPTQRENELGYGEVIQLFKVSKVGMVAGMMIQQGKVLNKARVRLVRDGVVVYDGKMDSLRRYQDDAKEVLEGQDCGIHLENFNDVKLGDRMEFYELEEVAPEL
jgi:translation initiation factor IF-2